MALVGIISSYQNTNFNVLNFQLINDSEAVEI